MGQVYEAEDLALHERVALKTVHPHFAQDESAIERFRREVYLARKVTHPNVCRLFDLFRHGASTPPILFVSMELLCGETLADRLARTGRMRPEEALPIARQLVAALAAAHRAGVVHRDFKSGNVLLVPPREGGGAVRAVVTDFGLARSTAGDGFDTSAHATGDIVGTPGYMAPEQVQDRAVTEQVDVYALGVVLYEMVTGRWPFVGSTPLATAIQRLQAPPPSPRTCVPDLDPRWERGILGALAREPHDRFREATDVLKALEGESVAPRAALRLRRWLLAASGAALIAVAAAAAIVVSRPNPSPATAGTPARLAAKARPSLVVLGFRNLSKRSELEWLSTAFGEMLSTELAAGEKLRVVPAESLARMSAGPAGEDTLRRVRRSLGADFAIAGSYLALEEEPALGVRLDLSLRDAVTGETLARVAETGTASSLFDLVARAGARLRQRLGVEELSARDASGVRASLPSSTAAARLYAEGLARLRRFDSLAARDLFEKAVATDPGYPLAHAALAEAFSALGYDERARGAARKAYELSHRLSRQERLLVEARYFQSSWRWDKAVEIHRSLFLFFPDDLEHGLRLAAAQTAAAQGKDALASLELLRAQIPAARGDPRVDLAEAAAAASLSDWEQQRTAAARAATAAAQLQATLLTAEARASEGHALVLLGQGVLATSTLQEAKRLFAEAAQREGVARALSSLGQASSDFPAARKLFEEAIAIHREIGNRKGIAEDLYHLGQVESMLGAHAAARGWYEESLAIFREIGDKKGIAYALNNVANVLLAQGELWAAATFYGEVISIAEELGNKAIRGMATSNLGSIFEMQGKLAEAKKRYEEGLKDARERRHRTWYSLNLMGLGSVATAEGDLQRARSYYEETRKDRYFVDEVDFELAGLALEEDRFAVAEQLARKAAGGFHTARRGDFEARARAVLALALGGQGKRSEAERAMEQAVALSDRIEERGVRLGFEIGRARFRAASGHPGEVENALRSLRAVVAEVRKRGFARYELEARLAEAEIERRSRDARLARSRLRSLQEEAAARGYRLLARKAAAALR
jgi:serine/threonine protein kinase/tetratricopeptide (TPR) repeat protein